jgi:hypothetical protein
MTGSWHGRPPLGSQPRKLLPPPRHALSSRLCHLSALGGGLWLAGRGSVDTVARWSDTRPGTGIRSLGELPAGGMAMSCSAGARRRWWRLGSARSRRGPLARRPGGAGSRRSGRALSRRARKALGAEPYFGGCSDILPLLAAAVEASRGQRWLARGCGLTGGLLCGWRAC